MQILLVRLSYLHLKICISAFQIIYMFHSFHGLRRWTQQIDLPNVWVFIAQMVELCSPDAEAMGVNSVEVLNFFQIYFQLLK